MTIHVDQLKRSVGITANPQRIVSLVPSQTELLHGLGIDERVVGITKFCVHPASWLQTKTIVGGTKKIDADTIDQLKPDLIIANKEENNKDQVELLAKKVDALTTKDLQDVAVKYFSMQNYLKAVLKPEK